jgi:hypothetical protein
VEIVLKNTSETENMYAKIGEMKETAKRDE